MDELDNIYNDHHIGDDGYMDYNNDDFNVVDFNDNDFNDDDISDSDSDERRIRCDPFRLRRRDDGESLKRCAAFSSPSPAKKTRLGHVS